MKFDFVVATAAATLEQTCCCQAQLCREFHRDILLTQQLSQLTEDSCKQQQMCTLSKVPVAVITINALLKSTASKH